jgi:arylsulfatase A-like enzyme
MSEKPNVLFILADQLRAASLPVYGETQIETPNIDRLAREGVKFNNMISTCPVCTPYRSMLLTGRHPQTTGHIINFVRTRHDEIGLADAFSRQGYKTGWIGKWHLHTGSFPQVEGKDWVPEGRDRLGFEYWRGYNFHCQYFGGWVNTDSPYMNARWDGYETDALNRYAFEFMDAAGDDPFCVFVSPHQPHFTGASDFAPEKYYENLPETFSWPPNVPEDQYEIANKMYRDYLAMTLALDDMVGDLLDYLDKTGKAKNTLVIFTSDHGTQGGAHGIHPWRKLSPYQESLKVPMLARLPGVFEGGIENDTLTAPVDFMPTLCSLCGVPVPRTVEGHDLSDAWQGKKDAFEQDGVLTMNFTDSYDFIKDGAEWRGVRGKKYNYARWLNGRTELFDLEADPLEMNNLADDPASKDARHAMERRLKELLELRGDRLAPCSEMFGDWYDNYRRVVKNAWGTLGDPEDSPDWSLLK